MSKLCGIIILQKYQCAGKLYFLCWVLENIESPESPMLWQWLASHRKTREDTMPIAHMLTAPNQFNRWRTTSLPFTGENLIIQWIVHVYFICQNLWTFQRCIEMFRTKYTNKNPVWNLQENFQWKFQHQVWIPQMWHLLQVWWIGSKSCSSEFFAKREFWKWKKTEKDQCQHGRLGFQWLWTLLKGSGKYSSSRGRLTKYLIE